MTAVAADAAGAVSARVEWRVSVGAVLTITSLTLAVFWPTLRNGFLPLGFDDALITDTLELRALGWQNVGALFTQFNHAHYVPLTMLSLAIDYHFWGLNPVGYHLTNILLHIATALLLYVFLGSIVEARRLALLATLLFALHPVQMEAVSLAVQRKTVLSGALFFMTLIFYQRWATARLPKYYAACVLTFVAAVLAKPSVVILPCLLVLYDEVFGDKRWRLIEKLPFFVIAGVITLVTMRAHAAVEAVHPPHGGTMLSNLLMVSRVTFEYIAALFLPVGLAPIYYYPRDAVYAPQNFVALAMIPAVCAYVTWHRQRYRWTFFCLAWFALVLLPESNLVPIAQLRADRFLYLGVMAFGVWVARGIERLQSMRLPRVWGRMAKFLGPALVGIFAAVCYASAAVWYDNVSAWRRVVERHQWCAMAYTMLGRAYYDERNSGQAELALVDAVRLSADLPMPHLYLAKIYAERGQTDLARLAAHRFLELAPNDPDGVELRATVLKENGS